MLLPMLKAVTKMLDYSGNPDALAFCTQVKCAKYVLDEIIVNLETQKEVKDYYEDLKEAVNATRENPKPVSKEKTQAATPTLQPTATLEPKPEVEVPKDKEWFVTLDDSKNLYIEGFPEDGMVELDGKKMKYKDTRGIKFQKAKIL